MKKGIIVLLLAICVSSYAQHLTGTADPNIHTLRVRYLSEALEPSGNLQRPYLVLPESGVIDGSDENNTLEFSFDYLSHDIKHLTYEVKVLESDADYPIFSDYWHDKAIGYAEDAKKAEELEQRMKSNRFTLQDYYDQLVQMKSMGSMEEILAQMPGGANMKGLKVDEKQMARTEAIILSMTPYEREHPNVIAASRKKRIAAGSGTKVEDVNRLLKSFEQMQKMIKQLSGPGMGKKLKRMSRSFGGFKGGFPGF